MCLDHGLILLEGVDAFGHAIRLQALIVHQLHSGPHDLLPGRSADHALMPRLHVWKPFEFLVWCTEYQSVNAVVPHRESEIRKGHFVADQPLSALECSLKYTKHAFELPVVTFDGRWNLLGVKGVEPTSLAKVRALATYLEGEPLIAEMLLLKSVIAEDMLGIVLFDDVLDDCTSLP
jgi:hypothetical protein